MTDDFVTEADRAVQRLHAKRRRHQTIAGGGLGGFALLTLVACGPSGVGSLSFVFLSAAVGITLWLEWSGMRVEKDLENVPLEGKRVHFVSGRDGLVFSTNKEVFVESRGGFERDLTGVAYLGETHELRFEQRRGEAGSAFSVQLPRDMTPQNGLKLAKQVDGWFKAPAKATAAPKARPSS